MSTGNQVELGAGRRAHHHTPVTPTIDMSALASSSRVRLAPTVLRSARGMAGFNPHMASPSDSRTDVIRSALYPVDSVAPANSSPVGARHIDYEARLRAVLPSAEAHETVERAWQLFRREKRERKHRELSAKYAAMEAACDELDALTGGEGGKGPIPRGVYDRAMQRMAHGAAAHQAALQGQRQGKKKTPESKWKEARVEGLVPREAWVPVETRGTGWNYSWTRPSNDMS